MRVKVLEGGRLPQKKYPTDAGFDLYSPEGFTILPGEIKKIPLKICIEIKDGEVALVQGRSGLASKNGITTIGNVIDQGYTGEISAILVNLGKEEVLFSIGDRIAQLIVIQLGNQELIEINELNETDRATSGYGSSGK